MTETMITLVVFMLLAAGVFGFFTSFQHIMRQNQIRVTLLNDARLTLERMVWGTQTTGETSRNGIWEARQLTVVTPNILEFEGTDGVDRRIRLSGQNIEYVSPGNPTVTLYDPNGADPDDTGQYSVNVTFSQTIPRAVDIEMVLGRRVVGRWIYASLSTQVAIRNN